MPAPEELPLVKVPLDRDGREQLHALLRGGDTLVLRRVRVLAGNRAAMASEVSVPLGPELPSFFRDLARVLEGRLRP